MIIQSYIKRQSHEHTNWTMLSEMDRDWASQQKRRYILI